MVWSQRHLLRYVRRSPARRILGPGLGQIQRPVNKSVPLARDIGCEYADLAVGDLAPTGSSPVAKGPRAGVLPRYAAGGLALLQKTGLVNHQNGVIRRQVLERIIAHDVAQRIGIPAATPPNCPMGIAYCRQGPGSPAASARIQPVLRRSSPSSP